MGFWDTLCPLCGVAPDGGPTYLAAEWRLEDELQPLIPELRALGAGKGLDDTELLQILTDGFDPAIADETVLPRGYGKDDYCESYVGIGYWGDSGEFNCSRRLEDKRILVPDGKEVELLSLANADGYGGVFNNATSLGGGGGRERKQDHLKRVDCDPADSPCFFLCEHCYHYLSAWSDTSAFPERSHAFPNDTEPISFAGEIYEIINSRKKQRGYSGTLPEMEYDDIEDSLDQCQDFIFPYCWKTGRLTALAIEADMRGKDLLPAIMRDSRAWMFMRPNVWPVPPTVDDTPKFTEFSPGAQPAVASLPFELLIPLLAELPLSSILTVSSTCRSLRNLITQPSFLDRVLREAILRGSLKWICPVPNVPREENKRARKSLLSWMDKKDPSSGPDDEHESVHQSDTEEESHNNAEDDGDDKSGDGSDDESDDESTDGADMDSVDFEDYTDGEDPVSIIGSPDFPRLAFVRACWESDSMMNRKRLWGQVKRFEVLWRDYRENGWQDAHFYPASERPKADEWW